MTSSHTASAAAARKARALQAFMGHKAEIEALLARMSAHAADHFGRDPEMVTWADEGSLASFKETLQGLSDAMFGEGEHAE